MNVERALPGREVATGAMLLIGIIGTTVAGMILYTLAIVVVHEVLANAGVGAENSGVFRSAVEFAFSVPMLAVGAYVAAAVVNGSTSSEFNPKRLALSVVGVYTAAAAVFLMLLSWGWL